jgi:hypothetical protein
MAVSDHQPLRPNVSKKEEEKMKRTLGLLPGLLVSASLAMSKIEMAGGK